MVVEVSAHGAEHEKTKGYPPWMPCSLNHLKQP